MNENEKSVNQNSQGNGGSNKLMLLIGLLLGIAIISTIAFFVLLFKSAKTDVEKNKGEVEGATVKQEVNNSADKPAQVPKKAAVDLTKLAITADDHVKGNGDAPVTVVLYDDMECPFCGAFEGTNEQVMSMLKQRSPGWEPVMPNLIKDYVNHGKVKIVYRHFPLSFHQNALPSAEATECAGTQGKFWEMHDKIFAINGEELNLEKFKQMARDLKLNMDKYNACMDKHEMQNEVKEDMQSATELGIEGTPAAFVNGQLLSGAVPYDSFRQVVEENLR